MALLAVLDPAHPLRPLLADALAVYGALILSFLGGVRWGAALHDTEGARARLAFAIGVVPSLIGWFALLLPKPHVFAVVALAFAAQGAWDAYSRMPRWFIRLRLWLTFIVTAIMALAVLAWT